jgi:hypothetical protein
MRMLLAAITLSGILCIPASADCDAVCQWKAEMGLDQPFKSVPIEPRRELPPLPNMYQQLTDSIEHQRDREAFQNARRNQEYRDQQLLQQAQELDRKANRLQQQIYDLQSGRN